jgi:type IV secretion system protein VirD4
MGHVNASVDHIERPLMTPDEVLRLKPPKKRGDKTSERIVAPGQMLIFVSGHHPILGTQMLYFLDPELASRAALEPPTNFYTLEDGKPVPQSPLDRTRNRITKPELFGTTADFPGTAERRFLAEMGLETGVRHHAEEPN